MVLKAYSCFAVILDDDHLGRNMSYRQQINLI